MSRDARFEEQAQALGYRFDGEIKIGGNYVPLVRDGHHIYLSGQIPRVGDTVVVTGAVVLNKDFGMGYSYPVIIEDAQVTIEAPAAQ